MTTSPGDSLSDVTDAGTHAPFTPASVDERRAQNDIVRVLADFQTGLESLKTLHAQRESLQQELISQRDELVERDRLLESQRAGLEADRAEVKRREDAAREECRWLRSQCSVLADLADEFERLWHADRAAWGELWITSESHRAHALTAEARASQAQAALESVSGLPGELERERQTLDALTRELAEAKGRFAGETSRREDESRRADEAEAALAASRAKLEALAQGVASLRDDLARARKEADHLRATPRGKGDEFNARRRTRLSRYRQALRRTLSKVRKASDAVGKRMEQADKIIAQRADLMQVRTRVLDAERRVQKAAARARGSVMFLCTALGLAVLGTLSWAAARQVAPATFIAQATLKADGRGRELNKAELAEWEQFHLELLGDPMFHEIAAERFMRQGLASLATPAAVSGLLTSSVHADSLADGELTLFLQGKGSDSTRRTTEALAASVASFANAAQQRRIDGGATIIPSPAKVDTSPLDHTRTFYAIGMMAISTLVCAFVGGTIWKRMAYAKSRFEADSLVSGALDEAAWADIERPEPKR